MSLNDWNKCLTSLQGYMPRVYIFVWHEYLAVVAHLLWWRQKWRQALIIVTALLYIQFFLILLHSTFALPHLWRTKYHSYVAAVARIFYVRTSSFTDKRRSISIVCWYVYSRRARTEKLSFYGCVSAERNLSTCLYSYVSKNSSSATSTFVTTHVRIYLQVREHLSRYSLPVPHQSNSIRFNSGHFVNTKLFLHV